MIAGCVPSGAKAPDENRPETAALKRCATQKQNHAKGWILSRLRG
jgi:hypothetical protein